jgi:hypothetical protein
MAKAKDTYNAIFVDNQELVPVRLLAREAKKACQSVGYDECVNCGRFFDASPKDKMPICRRCK